jgi:phosphohistidine phosphatase SixA
MMRRNSFIRVAIGSLTLALISGVFKGFSGLLSQAQAQEKSTPDPLIRGLKRGGHVIYFRHGNAKDGARPNAVAELPSKFSSCKNPERPLTDAGVTDMRLVGKSFRELGIPIDQVLSSPSCRAIESAWLAFNRAEIEPSLDGSEREQIRVELQQLLIKMPRKGANAVLSAHSTNIKALTGLEIAEGEAVIFRPDGQGNFTLVARKTPQEWATLAGK